MNSFLDIFEPDYTAILAEIEVQIASAKAAGASTVNFIGTGGQHEEMPIQRAIDYVKARENFLIVQARERLDKE